MRKLLILAVMFCPAMFGYASFSGFCEQGGVKVTVQGINSTSTFMQSWPNLAQSAAGPHVTVYLPGTTTKATPIFSDNAGTVLANPFPCSATGYFTFYGPYNAVDLLFSGTGITPFTRAGIQGQPPVVIPDGVVCDGSHDDTTAFNTALATGVSILVPQSTSYCKITSPLNLSAVGQNVYGFGHLSKIVQAGTNSNSTVFSIASLGHNEISGVYLLPNSTVTGPGSTVYGYGIKVYLSDHVNINHVEVSGSRRGGFIIQDSNYADVSDNDIHDSAVNSSTDSASEAGNDIYFYGSSSYGVVSRNHMTSGSGIAIAFQTSAITDVMCYNKAIENVINGEGMYGIIFYNTNASNLCSGGSAVANTVNNITGAIVAVGGDPTSKYFGAAIYVASAEKVLVDANICDRYNVSTNNLQQAPGCPGISGASDVTVTNNKGYNSGSYGASAFRAEADTNPSGKHVWTGNTYVNAASAAFSAQDIPNLDFSHNHIWANSNTGPALIDLGNVHRDQSLYHTISYNDIVGYGQGILQTSKVLDTQAIGNTISQNTNYAILLDSVTSSIKDNEIHQGVGGIGISIGALATAGTMRGNFIRGGSICVVNDSGSIFLIDQNDVGTNGGAGVCTTAYSAGSGEEFPMTGATPSVAGQTRDFRITDTTAKTNFLGGTPGQWIILRAQGVSVRINETAYIHLAGSHDFAMDTNDLIGLKFISSSWVEQFRTVSAAYISGNVLVRDSAGTGTCTITFVDGKALSTTC